MNIFLVILRWLSYLTPRVTAQFAGRLFLSPRKFDTPKREKSMDESGRRTKLSFNGGKSEAVLYRWGVGEKKVMLVHGWSGRGTQLFKIVEKFQNNGYSVYSFDAPGHGRAGGKTVTMDDFISIFFKLDNEYGPFKAAIGHSFGGMAIINAVNQGWKLEKMAMIGSGDKITDIMRDFIGNLGLNPAVFAPMYAYFVKRFKDLPENYNSSKVARNIKIPVLIIHDKQDLDVPVSAAKNTFENLKQGEILLTEGLGHRKILGDGTVLDKLLTFVNN